MRLNRLLIALSIVVVGCGSSHLDQAHLAKAANTACLQAARQAVAGKPWLKGAEVQVEYPPLASGATLRKLLEANKAVPRVAAVLSSTRNLEAARSGLDSMGMTSARAKRLINEGKLAQAAVERDLRVLGMTTCLRFPHTQASDG